jgi:hypothetical protein
VAPLPTAPRVVRTEATLLTYARPCGIAAGRFWTTRRQSGANQYERVVAKSDCGRWQPGERSSPGVCPVAAVNRAKRLRDYSSIGARSATNLG